MTTPDLLLLAVIGVSTLLGLMRGFIGALASLAAWILAGWVAFHFGSQLASVFAGTPDPGPTQLLEGYIASFIGVLIFVGLIGWILRKLVHSVGLSGLDRALGVALGLVRGGFVACMLVLLMGFTAIPHEAVWRQSQVVPVLLPGAQWMRGWLPGWAAARVDFGAARAQIVPLAIVRTLPARRSSRHPSSSGGA
jgi:membrane protein required for colicin V production